MALALLNNENYQAFIREKDLAIILFYAGWEPVHRRAEPVLEALQAELGDTVNLGKFNVDQITGWPAADIPAFTNVPTTVFYKGGKHLEMVTGVGSPEQYRWMVQHYLASARDGQPPNRANPRACR